MKRSWRLDAYARTSWCALGYARRNWSVEVRTSKHPRRLLVSLNSFWVEPKDFQMVFKGLWV